MDNHLKGPELVYGAPFLALGLSCWTLPLLPMPGTSGLCQWPLQFVAWVREIPTSVLNRLILTALATPGLEVPDCAVEHVDLWASSIGSSQKHDRNAHPQTLPQTY